MISHLEKTKRMKKFLYIILTLLISLQVSAKVPDKPNPPKLVNDFANEFSKQEKHALETKLVSFSRATSTQIVLVTVKTLDGEAPWAYAQQLGESWGVGQKGFDNGIVILIKSKTASSKGEVFIATGYGLEAVIPDATAKLIVDNEMIPEFKKGNMYDGVIAAVNTLQSLSLKEFSADEYRKDIRKEERIGGGVFTLILIVFIISSLFSGARRRGNASVGRSGLSTWILLSMLGSGRSHSGSFGNFSSGGGSFGGGGFGGFGGGSFGGGGAGGSW